MKRRALIFAALLALPASVIAKPPYAGRPLIDVIEEMQERGLVIVYTTELVKPSMRVAFEPQAISDRAVLEEILTPHGLAVKEGRGGVLSIVRAARRKSAAPQNASLPSEPALPVTLGSIVVAASNYAVLGSAPERRDFLTRQELNRTAHLGDDLFRALSQLPGAAATDYSAAFSVRGGLPEETLVILDGMEIAEPFHIKYFQNAISVIDSDAIGSLDYLSGGAPVEYGSAMSGVIDMATATPQQRRHTYTGISFTHARVVSDGTFDDDRGHWLVSLRRGYFDLLLGLFYSDVTARPRYSDVIAKMDYRVGDRSLLSTNVLAALDRIHYADGGDKIEASYPNAYLWVNLRTSWSEQLSSQTVASVSRLRQRKRGSLETDAELGFVHDNRSFDILGAKQDWTIDRPDLRQFVKFGADAKHFRTRYDYGSEASTIEPLLRFVGNPAERAQAVSIAPSGTAMAVYAADRVRITERLAAEAGVRYERESWLTDDARLSPRLNVVYAPNAQTALRASWGEFRQAQRLDDIAVEDGDVTTYRAQRSKQVEIGIEHHFERGLLLRSTAYRRAIDNVRPRYENLFDRDELFPEVKYDRVRIAPESAAARGVELLIKDESSRPFTWWLSVARSRATDRIEGQDVPRSWDQPHVVSFNTNYRRSNWNFNLAGLFHSGWPTTAILASYQPAPPSGIPVTLSLGPRNGERLRPYRRVDTRVMYSRPLSRGTFRSWLEVTNALDHPNPCCIGGFSLFVDPSQQTVAVRPDSTGLGWLPSFGVAWEF